VTIKHRRVDKRTATWLDMALCCLWAALWRSFWNLR